MWIVLEALIDGIDPWSCAWEKQLLCATVKSSTYLIPVTDGVYNIPVAVSSVSGNQLTTFAWMSSFLVFIID